MRSKRQYKDNQHNIKNVSTEETTGEKLAMRLPPGTDDFDQETSAMNFQDAVSQMKTMKRQEDGPYSTNAVIVSPNYTQKIHGFQGPTIVP